MSASPFSALSAGRLSCVEEGALISGLQTIQYDASEHFFEEVFDVGPTLAKHLFVKFDTVYDRNILAFWGGLDRSNRGALISYLRAHNVRLSDVFDLA
jgi:hypothetical protein